MTALAPMTTAQWRMLMRGVRVVNGPRGTILAWGLDPDGQAYVHVRFLWATCTCGARMKVRSAERPRCRGCRWRDRQRARRWTGSVVVPAGATGIFTDLSGHGGSVTIHVNSRDTTTIRTRGIAAPAWQP